jgi:hypothetical protein
MNSSEIDDAEEEDEDYFNSNVSYTLPSEVVDASYVAFGPSDRMHPEYLTNNICNGEPPKSRYCNISRWLPVKFTKHE